MSGTEIIFEVSEDELDGGYSASALGFGIHTQGDSLNDLRRNVREAVDCYFDDGVERPRLIRLHFVRDDAFVERKCASLCSSSIVGLRADD